MKQLPRDHPRPAPASERSESRPPPRSVREGARRGDRSGGRELRRPTGSKPRPARDLAVTEEVVRAPEPSAPPAPDAEEARLEVDGQTWTVRVLGRSGRGSRGEAPLLLLGFWEGDPDDAPPLRGDGRGPYAGRAQDRSPRGRAGRGVPAAEP